MLRSVRLEAAMSCSSGLYPRRFLGGSLRPAAERYLSDPIVRNVIGEIDGLFLSPPDRLIIIDSA